MPEHVSNMADTVPRIGSRDNADSALLIPDVVSMYEVNSVYDVTALTMSLKMRLEISAANGASRKSGLDAFPRFSKESEG